MRVWSECELSSTVASSRGFIYIPWMHATSSFCSGFFCSSSSSFSYRPVAQAKTFINSPFTLIDDEISILNIPVAEAREIGIASECSIGTTYYVHRIQLIACLHCQYAFDADHVHVHEENKYTLALGWNYSSSSWPRSGENLPTLGTGICFPCKKG